MTGRPDAETILRVLVPLMCRLCEQPDLALAPATLLAEIPGIDSLRQLQAVALLEEHFDVEVDVAALDDLTTVGDVIAVIAQARPAGGNLPE